MILPLLSLWVLTGCQSEGEPRLKVGTGVSLSYVILYLARELGYLDGLRIDLVELSSDTDVQPERSAEPGTDIH